MQAYEYAQQKTQDLSFGDLNDQLSLDEYATFFYYTERDHLSLVELMNHMAFGGHINEKLYQFMKLHIDSIKIE